MFFYLSLNRCANRAGTGAGTAIDAVVSVDNVLAVGFGDAAYGALVSASAAGDALIGNLISHGVTILPGDFAPILLFAL